MEIVKAQRPFPASLTDDGFIIIATPYGIAHWDAPEPMVPDLGSFVLSRWGLTIDQYFEWLDTGQLRCRAPIGADRVCNRRVNNWRSKHLCDELLADLHKVRCYQHSLLFRKRVKFVFTCDGVNDA